MGDFVTKDGRRYFVEQGDGNDVLYLRNPSTGEIIFRDGSPVAVWDKWSWEQQYGSQFPELFGGAGPTPPVPGPGPIPIPDQPTPGPPPSVGNVPEGFPSGRGHFRMSGFSARLFRVTVPSDGNVRPVGMSYWPVINNHTGRGYIYVLASLDDHITIFAVDLLTGEVAVAAKPPYFHTGEGCYWSLKDPDVFYVPLSNRLVRHHMDGSFETVFDAPGEMRQVHTSYDGQAHSFTVNNQPGALHYGTFKEFQSSDYDECQIDKSGRWLLIKENGADNRVVDLQTGRSWTIGNRDGAVGHSDCGFNCVIGENDMADPGGCFTLWEFTESGPVHHGSLYCTGNWNRSTRYVSFCNARPGDLHGQRMLFSSAEIGLVSLVVGQGPITIAPPLTDINAGGGRSGEDNYWTHPRPNLCPPGKYAAWTGNYGSDRLDLFVAEMP